MGNNPNIGRYTRTAKHRKRASEASKKYWSSVRRSKAMKKAHAAKRKSAKMKAIWEAKKASGTPFGRWKGSIMLTGENGIGKSHMIETISGQVQPLRDFLGPKTWKALENWKADPATPTRKKFADLTPEERRVYWRIGNARRRLKAGLPLTEEAKTLLFDSGPNRIEYAVEKVGNKEFTCRCHSPATSMKDLEIALSEVLPDVIDALTRLSSVLKRK